MTWLPLPNKQDGDGYTEFVDHPDGAAHFGCWVAILEVASKCDPRGTLLRDGAGGVARPHDAASLARITRLPAALLEQAIARLLVVGWLEAIRSETLDVTDSSQEDAAASHETATAPQIVAPSRARVPEGKGMEGKGRENTRAGASDTIKPIANPGVYLGPFDDDEAPLEPYLTILERHHPRLQKPDKVRRLLFERVLHALTDAEAVA